MTFTLLNHGVSLLLYIFRIILSGSLVFSACQYMGWIHRALHFWLEWFLWEVSNHTHVTVGQFEYDLWQGRVYATNVVIHTPLREEWKWSSPVIARVGRVYIEFSLVAWIQNVISLLSLEQAPIDIYTVEVADVQAFIERQEQVFNFYLLDPGIILPDPKTIVPQSDSEDGTTSEVVEGMEDARDGSTSQQQEENEHGSEENDEEAQQLVEQMLQTVQQLVSRKGTWKGALEEQRQTLTSKLRELQSTPNKVSAVQQHVRVMRQVGEAVAKKTQDLPAAPLRKEEEMPPVMVRVGRVVVRDLRIFTRDVMDSEEDVLLEKWNKPIRIDHVTVRASELTPPMSLLDDDKLPAIYQPIDKVWEVVWKRLLAESAKSQGGKLLNTAVGQVLNFIKVSK